MKAIVVYPDSQEQLDAVITALKQIPVRFEKKNIKAKNEDADGHKEHLIEAKNVASSLGNL